MNLSLIHIYIYTYMHIHTGRRCRRLVCLARALCTQWRQLLFNRPRVTRHRVIFKYLWEGTVSRAISRHLYIILHQIFLWMGRRAAIHGLADPCQNNLGTKLLGTTRVPGTLGTRTLQIGQLAHPQARYRQAFTPGMLLHKVIAIFGTSMSHRCADKT